MILDGGRYLKNILLHIKAALGAGKNHLITNTILQNLSMIYFGRPSLTFILYE